MNEELLYNQMYEKTADCGRTQFIRLLMDKERENQQLKEKLERVEKANKEAIKYLYAHSQYNDRDGIHYIKENEYCVDYLLDILDIDKGE